MVKFDSSLLHSLWLLKWCQIQSFYCMCSVLFYSYSYFSHLFCVQFLILFVFSKFICIQSHLIYIQSGYIYSVPSYLYSVSSYLYSVNLYIFSFILYVFSLILFIFSQLICIQSHIIFTQSTFIFCKHVLCVTLRNLIKICSFLIKSECMSYRTIFH